jgi:hypothetical protein
MQITVKLGFYANCIFVSMTYMYRQNFGFSERINKF